MEKLTAESTDERTCMRHSTAALHDMDYPEVAIIQASLRPLQLEFYVPSLSWWAQDQYTQPPGVAYKSLRWLVGREFYGI